LFLETLTCRATLPLELVRRPALSKTRTVPIGDCVAVAVVTMTPSESVHRDERASPRKPNVTTEVRSEKEASFDVWCFNAAHSFSFLQREQKREQKQHTNGFIIFRHNSTSIINNFNRFQAVVLKSNLCVGRYTRQVYETERDSETYRCSLHLRREHFLRALLLQFVGL